LLPCGEPNADIKEINYPVNDELWILNDQTNGVKSLKNFATKHCPNPCFQVVHRVNRRAASRRRSCFCCASSLSSSGAFLMVNNQQEEIWWRLHARTMSYRTGFQTGVRVLGNTWVSAFHRWVRCAKYMCSFCAKSKILTATGQQSTPDFPARRVSAQHKEYQLLNYFWQKRLSAFFHCRYHSYWTRYHRTDHDYVRCQSPTSQAVGTVHFPAFLQNYFSWNERNKPLPGQQETRTERHSRTLIFKWRVVRKSASSS